MTIKNNLRHILVDRNMSIRQLSEETGITYSMVYNFAMMKQRSVSFSLLEEVCKHLGVQPGDVLVYDVDEDQRP